MLGGGSSIEGTSFSGFRKRVADLVCLFCVGIEEATTASSSSEEEVEEEESEEVSEEEEEEELDNSIGATTCRRFASRCFVEFSLPPLDLLRLLSRGLG